MLNAKSQVLRNGHGSYELVDRLHRPNLRDVVLEVAFHTHLKRDLAAGATDARPVESDLHHAVVGDVHKLNITAV